MPKSFGLTFADHDTGAIDTVAIEISDDEWQLLLEFANYADQLGTTEFVQDGIRDHCEIAADGSLRITNPLPPAGYIRELLHVLRPFILEKERTYYNRITSILRRRIDHRLWHGLIKGYVRSFRADNSQKFFTVKVEDLVLNSEEALDLWLNGYEYHHDPEKRTRLASNTTGELSEASRSLFVDTLGAKVEAILEVRDLIRYLERGSILGLDPSHIPPDEGAT